MDTGAGYSSEVPSEPPLLPVESTGHKRKHSSLSGQVDTENSVGKVLAQKADRNTGSTKRAKPLAVNKNSQNRQTSLPFSRIDNVDQTKVSQKEETMAKAPLRASQDGAKAEAPLRASQKEKAEAPLRASQKEKAKAPLRASQKEKAEAPLRASQKKKAKAPLRASQKEKAKAPLRASQKKQSVLDGFFETSQGHIPKAPVPTTSGQITETPFNKSKQGSEQDRDDGWQSDWETDANEDDDYSHMLLNDEKATSDNKVIGDDEVLPGPEGEDCSVDDLSNQPNVETSSAEMQDLNGQLFKTIREVVLFLKKWASQSNFMTLKDKPMTLGFWSLLSRVDVDFLMGLWAPAISPMVQALFEKDTFSVEDLRNLPNASRKERTGIYMGFIVDERHDGGTVTLALYVGSSICMKIRIHEHKQKGTWRRLKGSRFYQKLVQGKKVEFCVLASFDSPIERGYLNLLEAIFMFLFGTLLQPSYESEFVKQSTWELYDQVQAALGHRPRINGQIVGLNQAWPLTQGFVNKGCKTRSKCNNPQCMIITVPAKEPKEEYPLADGEFVSRAPRLLSDHGDPLGPYLCSSCYFYQRDHGKLPDKTVTEFRRKQRYCKRWLKNQRELKLPIPCSVQTCSRVEDPKYTRHTRFHVDTTTGDRVLCTPCWVKYHPKSKPKDLEDAVCRNPHCCTRPGGRSLTGETITRLVKGLCPPCGVSRKNRIDDAKKANEDMKAEDDYLDDKMHKRVLHQIKFDILSGNANHCCSSCGTELKQLAWSTYKSGPSYGLPSKWSVKDERLFCQKCNLKRETDLSRFPRVFEEVRPLGDILQDWWPLYDPILAERKQELKIAEAQKKK